MSKVTRITTTKIGRRPSSPAITNARRGTIGELARVLSGAGVRRPQARPA